MGNEKTKSESKNYQSSTNAVGIGNSSKKCYCGGDWRLSFEMGILVGVVLAGVIVVLLYVGGAFQ